MVQISSVLIRETRVYPCPDFKLSGSQAGIHFSALTMALTSYRIRSM